MASRRQDSIPEAVPEGVELLPCPRCGAPAKYERGCTYYLWSSLIKCTNPRCRIRMFGSAYGNNGLIDPRRSSTEGELESYTKLAERWNERPRIQH